MMKNIIFVTVFVIVVQHTTTKTSGLEYDIQKRTTDIKIVVGKP